MFPVNVKRTVEIPYDFFMMESLATNSMFRAFVQETGYRTSVSRYGTGWVVDSQPKWRQGIGNDWEVPPLWKGAAGSPGCASQLVRCDGFCALAQ
jgi:formylglycine-generating enzyme required for sulfatase activity